MNALNARNLTVDVGEPKLFSGATWLNIQRLEINAWKDALVRSDDAHSVRTEADIKHMFQYYNVDEYLEARLDPQRRYPNQRFAKPLGLVAYYSGELAAAAYISDNTSSQFPGRLGTVDMLRKMHDPHMSKRYGWLRGVAVEPRLQGEGLGSFMTYLAFRSRHERQPGTTYLFEEMPHYDAIVHRLESVGFDVSPEADPREEVRFGYFGKDRDPVEQHRAAVKNVGEMLMKVEAQFPSLVGMATDAQIVNLR